MSFGRRSAGHALCFDHVSFSYAGSADRVLSDITTTVPRGGVTVLVGPCGSGKTTFCDLATGVIPHLIPGTMHGRVLIEGIASTLEGVPEIATTVGRVFQEPELMFARLEVEEEISFGLENLGLSPEEIGNRVSKALDSFRLKPYRNTFHWNLSGGEVRRLAFACVSVLSPSVFVFDEPTAHLDPMSEREVFDRILRLRDHEKTVLLVTRKLAHIAPDCDKVIVLKEGRVLLDGRPQDVLAENNREMLSDVGIRIPRMATAVRGQSETTGVSSRGNTSSAEPATLPCLPRQDVLPAGRDRPSGITGEDLMSTKNLCFSYDEVPVIRGLSLSLGVGEIVALVGPNGSGKTSLAKVLGGVLRPNSGKLCVHGEELRTRKWDCLLDMVSLMLQNPRDQFVAPTVLEEAVLSFQCLGESRPQSLRKAWGMLAEARLSELAHRHPLTLSAGQQRRLAMASVVCRPAELVILDEPTYGQDQVTLEWVRNTVRGLRDAKTSVLLITQDMQLVSVLADRVLVLVDGELTFEGPPKELFCRHKIMKQAWLVPPGKAVLAQGVLGVAVSNGSG